LIKVLSKQLNFEYEVYLVPDGLYGDFISVDNTGRKTWNGLMKEVLSDKADLILAPFTITPERANFVDFTKPFKYQGITILVKRTKKDSNLVSFLQPFKQDLWLMILISIHIVALVLYLLDRFSPFAHFKLSNTTTGETEEDALNLSRAVWFTWGVLFNSGIGEGTPRSFSARVLGMVWAGFAMIMVSSYTANLAAFLVLDRPESSLTGINDARLRNNQENYAYATVKGSSVERYFKRQIELSTMYRTMENRNYLNVDDAIDALRKDEIKAFIWDSARLEYESRYSCEFICTGELFGRSSYALALKKGNPWLNKLSQQILILHESGQMEEFDKKWILLNNTYCQQKEANTLGLTNMAGVFMLVAGGIILGIFLIFIEIAYKKNKDKKIRKHVVSRKAFAIWRKKVEKNKILKQNHNNDYFYTE
jgi:glutamate receptor ionotropic, NMDA 1